MAESPHVDELSKARERVAELERKDELTRLIAKLERDLAAAKGELSGTPQAPAEVKPKQP